MATMGMGHSSNLVWWLMLLLMLASLGMTSATMKARARPQCDLLIVSGNPESPPLLSRSQERPGKLTGVVVPYLRETFEPLGITLDIREMGSWARVQKFGIDGGIDLIAGIYKTPERLLYFDYLEPPMTHLKTGIWINRGRKFDYRDWSDLRDLRGSTTIGKSFGSDFDLYARQYLKLERVRSIEQDFMMMRADRVDYVLYEELRGREKLKKYGMLGLFSMLDTPLTRQGLFLAFSKRSPCNTSSLRAAVSKRLADMVSQGRFLRILQAPFYD